MIGQHQQIICFHSVSVHICISVSAFSAVRQIRICPIPKFRTEIGFTLSVEIYIHLDNPVIMLTVMSAQIFLYVFACIYERICACRTVSLRETLTAVREWAC